MNKLEYGRQYYRKNRKRLIKQSKEYKKKHDKEIKEKYKIFYYSNPEKMKEKRRKHYIKYRKEILSNQKIIRKTPKYRKQRQHYRLTKKIKVLTYYSKKQYPICVGCDEKEMKILSLDHIKNDGKEHRKTLSGDGTGEVIYGWIIRNNFPKGFQTLCMNCQWKKRFNIPLPNTYKKQKQKK